LSEPEITAKDRILQKVQLKETLSRISENFQGYLFDCVEAETGQRPRAFSINDVSRVKKFGRTGSVDLISVQFGTDEGQQSAKIAVKFFRSGSLDEPQEEARKSRILQWRFESRNPPVSNIKTPKILYAGSKSAFLVYEGVDGDSYAEANIPPETKAFLVGKALAAIHGPELGNIELERYEGLVAMSTIQLPGAGSQLKDIFLNLFGKHMKLLKESPGGTTPFGDLHDGNILFSQPSSGEATPDNIITWIIDPEYLEETSGVSRFEDIGVFFSIFFYEEFENTNDISETVNQLQHFIRGYNGVLQTWGAPSLSEIYPNGLPINFDVSLALLVEGIDLMKRYGITEHTKTQYKKRVKFALKLLNENLIQI